MAKRKSSSKSKRWSKRKKKLVLLGGAALAYALIAGVAKAKGVSLSGPGEEYDSRLDYQPPLSGFSLPTLETFGNPWVMGGMLATLVVGFAVGRGSARRAAPAQAPRLPAAPAPASA
jgi:hypothetical protein